jgi:hypothetical protein
MTKFASGPGKAPKSQFVQAAQNSLANPSSSQMRQSKQNGSQISMQAVKQIKAEAFKSYISQATQLQQKILEQSLIHG